MPLTKQEIFDKATAHLLTQQKKSFIKECDGGSEWCQYLHPTDGTKCAIGCMIPDGHPGQKFEGPVWSLCAEYTDLGELFDLHNNKSLLQSLQRVHDTTPIKTWGIGLLNIAITYSLDATMLRGLLLRHREVFDASPS